MEAPRYCPLCDRERPEAMCAVHEVPTLPPATGQPPPITKGSVIVDRYRVQGVLSHGGMGTVLDATQVGFNRPVVVKVLRGAKADDRGRVRRFYVEARLVSTLDHPHIVRVFEFGVDPVFRVPFIAMERVDGVTLQDVIDEEGTLSEIRTAKLFEQIVRALMEAHEKGVLHRDLKPRNVMVRRLPEGEEHVTVLDFGLAKLLEEDASQPPLTAPGRTVGTPGFMSPEQVLGRKLDFRSDLYGVGCMMYNVLAGRPPFDGPAALGVMRRQVREPPPALPRVLEGGQPPSAALSRLLFSLLEKNPDDRPPRIEAVRDELTQLARGEPDGPATVLTHPARPAELPTVKTDSQEALRRSLSESDQVRTEPVEMARSNPSSPDDDEDGLATVQLPPGALDRLKTQPVPSLSSSRPAASVSSAQPARVRRVWTAVGIAALLAAAALLATVLA